MSTSRMYFNYDNDKKVYVLPVLPEELQIKVTGETSSVTIDRFGEILHKGKRDALAIKFSSFFPNAYGQYYCDCSQAEFRSAKDWHNWMKALLNADKPCHFVYTDAPGALNIYADITSYTAKEQGGDPGTIYYTVELKEHRSPTVRKYQKRVVQNTTVKKKSVVIKASVQNRINNVAVASNYLILHGARMYKEPYGKVIRTLKKNTIVASDDKTVEKEDSSSRGVVRNRSAKSFEDKYLHIYYKNKWGYILASSAHKLG